MINLNALSRELEQVISYAKGYENIDIDCGDLLNQWYGNKKFIIDKLGGKLIYEFPKEIEINLTEEKREKILEEFFSILNQEINNDILYYYIYDNKEGFFDNRIVDNTHVPLKNGAKLLKSFKYFESGKKLREAQDLASKYIQMNKLKGKLCISVHPLDFFTLSENNCGWTTCQAVDGTSAAGNISYMVDNCTFIVYLKTDKDTQLRCFPQGKLWNNKMWRTLCHFTVPSPDKRHGIWVNKNYPFECLELLNYLTKNEDSPFKEDFNCIKKVAYTDSDTENYEISTVSFDDGITIIPTSYFIRNNEPAYNYNDLTFCLNKENKAYLICNEKEFNEYYNYNFEPYDLTDVNFFNRHQNLTVAQYIDKIYFGSDIYISRPARTFKPICGHNAEFFKEGEDLVCADCGRKITRTICTCCDKTIFPLEEVYDGMCKECYTYTKEEETNGS